MTTTRPVISGQAPKLILRFLSHVGIISIIFLLSAAVYFYLVISGEIVEKAKVQENALLAGLVEEGWRDTSNLQNYLKELGKFKTKGGQSRSELRKFIFNSFIEMGIEVSRHQFQTIQSSFSLPNTTYGSGENIYAIIRTFRATPLEAICLVVPMRSTHIESISIALAFAAYAKNQLYWARDIIFLFADGGSKFAVEAWLSDYHGQRHPFFVNHQDELATHGGTLIAAFGLDISGTLFDTVELQYGMVNGKLPNMDLLNLFVLLVEKSGATPAINGVRRAMNEFDMVGAAQTFVNGIISQSLDELEPITAVFGRYGLHAITIKGRMAKSDKQPMAIDLPDVVRLVEGGMRSLNNLLEKFHHSYLLYILTHPHRFFSAALYMPLFGLLVAPLLLMSLREWFMFGGSDKLAMVGPTVRLFGCSHFAALAFYAIQCALYSDHRLRAGAQIAPFFLILYILVVYSATLFRPRMTRQCFHFARFLVSMELTLFLGALSLVHFSLALLLCLITLPVAIATLSIGPHFSLPIRLFIFSILCPISIGFSLLPLRFCIGQSAAICWHKLTTKFARIALAHFAHGSWLLALLSGPVLSICICYGLIISARVEVEKEEEEQNEKDEDEKKSE